MLMILNSKNPDGLRHSVRLPACSLWRVNGAVGLLSYGRFTLWALKSTSMS
jgi:hypothetical protein